VDSVGKQPVPRLPPAHASPPGLPLPRLNSYINGKILKLDFSDMVALSASQYKPKENSKLEKVCPYMAPRDQTDK
jgi:hypothetical protein